MRQALYRAYRPRDFDEVVGQEQVTTVLKNEMREGHPSHAYLFVGSRGTGKTSCAKLVAKAVNCLDLRGGNPCGVCDCCRGVDDGSLLDVVEIDAASNNGVDSIRELRDEAVFTPAVAKYRVYIIDEVHMLSTSAFNALLKILEEPPEHVIFVLATTEVQKVLPTIISRCQRFDFQRIEVDIIVDRLLEVAGREGFTLDREAARLIARLSDGGLRDALSMLDVCAAQAGDGGEIGVSTVRSAAGLAGSAHLMALTEKILAGDTAGVLQMLSELTAKSLDPQRLCEQLIGHYRDLMLVKTVGNPADLLGCLPSEIEPLRAQSAHITLSELLQSMTALQDAAARMGRSALKRAELELALVSLTEPSIKTGTQALLLRIERLEAAVRRGIAPPAAEESVSETSDRAEMTADLPRAVPPEPIHAQDPLPTTPESDTNVVPAARVAAASSGESVPFGAWGQVMEQIKTANPSLAGMLTGTKAYIDGKRVLIDFQNPVLLQMLKSNEYTKAGIKQAILSVTGRQYGLGPYRAPTRQQQTDPLEELIRSLPASDDIIIQ